MSAFNNLYEFLLYNNSITFLSIFNTLRKYKCHFKLTSARWQRHYNTTWRDISIYKWNSITWSLPMRWSMHVGSINTKYCTVVNTEIMHASLSCSVHEGVWHAPKHAHYELVYTTNHTENRAPCACGDWILIDDKRRGVSAKCWLGQHRIYVAPNALKNVALLLFVW